MAAANLAIPRAEAAAPKLGDSPCRNALLLITSLIRWNDVIPSRGGGLLPILDSLEGFLRRSPKNRHARTPSWKGRPPYVHCARNHVEYADNHLAAHESWQNTLIEDRSGSPGLDIGDSQQIRFLHTEVDVNPHRYRNLLPETQRTNDRDRPV